MLIGLPIESWLLIGASFGIGLAIEAAFLWRNRDAGKRTGARNRAAGP